MTDIFQDEEDGTQTYKHTHAKKGIFLKGMGHNISRNF